MADKSIIKISPSSLSLYVDCPRCFWLRFNEGINRPEPPTSTLPGGVDYTLKNYFDHWRANGGEPPLLKGKLPGRLLADQALISKFRSRSFGFFDKEANAYFNGMLDDALEMPDGAIVPLDNKTRGFPLKEIHDAYVNQMGAYTLFLQFNGLKTKNAAYLIFWFFDHKNMNLDDPLAFNTSVEEVKTDPDKILARFREAVAALREPMPPAGKECGFCAYRNIGY